MSDRRNFIRTAGLAGIGAVLSASALPVLAKGIAGDIIKVGIIGLDTEHSVAFTRTFHAPDAPADVAGFRVVAACPHGSRDIASSLAMIPGFTEEMKKMGVEITDSIEVLLTKVDVVLLETNDGRLHLEQALPVLKARKPVFIDKPIAASLADAVAIFKAAKEYSVPVFSSSSLRYMSSAREIVKGKVGKVTGADVYGPAVIEKTHPDLFWYGIHAIETLYTVMGTGCQTVTRTYTEGTDVVVGVWKDGRIGTFRGIREGAQDFGGHAFGDKGIAVIGPWEGYRPLVVEIATFFRTGRAPVSPEETVEIFAFMEAAERSKQQGGASVSLERGTGII
ncbi:MAG: dehydrogenase [Sphingobacteriales bacterium 50-39]|nr:Gfo/Idh/MocA family oxidoreductase [Sphingobacteriales bacterium]OJW61213.1 MAG: dehydrogenase [Sphingobacteriales bacterium 50-39]